MKIIRDTREQTGWQFPETYEVVDAALKYGDYTIEGKESLFVIERKASVSEIATNISEDRFVRELRGMKDIKYKYLLFEFSMYDVIYYPQSANLPARVKEKIKVTGDFILRRLLELQIEYNLYIIFCDNRQNAQHVAISIFKRMDSLCKTKS